MVRRRETLFRTCAPVSSKPSDTPVRIALLGAAGRMGQAIIETARDFPGVRIEVAVVRAGRIPEIPGLVSTGDLARALALSDVLLDFSCPASTASALDACIAAGKPMVTGVTGLGAETHNKLAAASHKIAVLAAPNMSLGANLLIALVGTAAAVLGPEFDVEITDIHHRAKRDAPSGTALAIGEAAARARGRHLKDEAVFARHGHDDVRRAGSIGFASLRAGDLAGEHRVLFAGRSETLELTHRAANRAAFAHGALAAARWIVRQPAGFYGMADVLNLRV